MQAPGRRRRVIAVLLTALILSVGGCAFLPVSDCESDPESCIEPPCAVKPAKTTADIRLAWRESLTGGTCFETNDDVFRSALSRLDYTADQSWQTLRSDTDAEPWADLDTSSPIDLLAAFARVRGMATAWATHGSRLEGDPELLADTITALAWLTEHRFNAETEYVSASWWYWEIGIPLEVNDLTVLLYDELSPEAVTGHMDAVQRFSPEVTRTGANRAWAALVVAQRGVIVDDPAAINAARDGILPALEFVTSGDGFYEDGSFVQHGKYAYTGGYGLGLMSTVAEFLWMLHGSPWQLDDPLAANPAVWVVRSFDPFMYGGQLMDAVRGREISRDYMVDHDAGAAAMRATLLLAETSEPETAQLLRSIVKRWIASDPVGDFWLGGSIADLRRGDALFDEGSVAVATPGGASVFNSMARAVFHADDFAFSVSMSSSRIATFEVVSGQNLRGWFTGDGMTSLYTADAEQYGDAYWPTVNPYRLPGTTVDTIPRQDGSGSGFLSASDYAGGVASASGLNGVAGMQLQSYGSATESSKAWFVFDDEIVALGNSIASTAQSGTGWDGEPRRVETVIDTQTVDASQTLTVNGTVVDAQVAVGDAGWAHLGAANGEIGYVFPGTAAVYAERAERTGAWSDINTARGSSETRSNDFATLWFEHGTAPDGASYAYIVLPNASEDETRAYSAQAEVIVLQNSPTVSAVLETGLNAVGAQFWSGGALAVNEQPFLTVSAAAALMTEESAGGIALTVADPTLSASGLLTVEIHRAATEAMFTSPGVTVVQLSPTIILSVDPTAATAGSPFAASFRY